MATDTSNSTSNSSYEKIGAHLPISECIPWVVSWITGCLATVIVNIITIIVFVKQRQLQRRSTYLIIHLAVVDLLSGAVSGPVTIDEESSKYCASWEYNVNAYYPLRHLFPLTSLGNLVLIAFERAHATYRPFKHRCVKKRVYEVIIFAMWLITTSMVSSQFVFYDIRISSSNLEMSVTKCIYFSYLSICLLVILFCYVSIFIKVRYGSHLQCRGAASLRERKLTSTLLLVTLASLLTWLPYAIFRRLSDFQNRAILNLPLRSYFHIEMALLMLLGANSLVNPIVYALRMPEFRAGIKQIFRRAPNHTSQADLPLENHDR